MILRQRMWIDNRVQGVLVGRILIYWAAALTYFGLGSTVFQFYQHPEWTFAEHMVGAFSSIWPLLPSIILFLPLIIFDIVRLSNLFVGPIYRLRAHLIELTADPNCRPLNFREDDYWQDLAEPLHILQQQLLQSRPPETEAKPEIDSKAKLSKIAAAIESAAKPTTVASVPLPADNGSESRATVMASADSPGVD